MSDLKVLNSHPTLDKSPLCFWTNIPAYLSPNTQARLLVKCNDLRSSRAIAESEGAFAGRGYLESCPKESFSLQQALSLQGTQIHLPGTTVPPSQSQSATSMLTDERLMKCAMLCNLTCLQLDQKHQLARLSIPTELPLITMSVWYLLVVLCKDGRWLGRW